MTDQALRFRIGLFVVLSLVVLTVLVALFGGLPRFGVASYRYIVELNDGAGITAGTPVRRSGVRIGEVTNVDLDNDTGKVLLTVEVPRDREVRQNEQAVVRRGVLGDPTIDFLTLPPPPGQEPNRAPVEPGARLQGVQQVDLGNSLAELNKAAVNFNKMSEPIEKTVREIGVAADTWRGVGERMNVLLRTNEDKLVETLDNFNTTVKRIGAVVGEENQRNLAATLKNVKTASENLDSLTKSTDELLREGRGTLKQVNGSLKSVDQVLGDLSKATKPLAERGESLVKNLDESAIRLNAVLTDIQELVRTFARGDGSLQRLVNDPAIYNNLNAVTCALAKMMPQVERILKDVEVFADKIARHPEALGVGGAVRPGSGVK